VLCPAVTRGKTCHDLTHALQQSACIRLALGVGSDAVVKLTTRTFAELVISDSRTPKKVLGDRSQSALRRTVSVHQRLIYEIANELTVMRFLSQRYLQH
jgi:hypothetical protein